MAIREAKKHVGVPIGFYNTWASQVRIQKFSK